MAPEQKIYCSHSRMAEIDSLVPYPHNENKHPPEQLRLLAKIMRHNGVRHPIVVSKRSGFITKGHGRLEAAKLNGWTHFPVDDQEYPNEAAEHADRIADNKIQELSEIDTQALQTTIAVLPEGFDKDLLGLTEIDVAALSNVALEDLIEEPNREPNADESEYNQCPECGFVLK